MKKVRISAVSYLNTVPFVYGLKHSPINQYIDLFLDTPAICASRLKNKDVDIGLVPVAIIPKLQNYKIISNYCIGADGNVRTVVLCSNTPIENINTVYLDKESLTSAMLSQILLRNYWKLTPKIEHIKNNNQINPDIENAGYVLIGDKVFEFENKFSYIYDLAFYWKSFKKLPFTFAVWTTVSKLSNEFLEQFNIALAFGLNNIEKAIEYRDILPTDKQTAIKYLTTNIDYEFDNKKKKSLIEFWNLALEEMKSKVRS